MLFCTSICANYLPKARSLAVSIKKNMPDAKIVVSILERNIPVYEDTLKVFDEVILAKDLGWNDFDSFIFTHSIVEGSTAVKGRLFLYLLSKYGKENKFVYLDPDVFVYSNFCELEHLLDVHSIIVAPHLLYPGNIDMEISSLAHGCYNLGFLAISRSQNSYDFLKWWSSRLFEYCYDDMQKGLFTDQRWVDLAPCFFDVYILKHHGYDFATWSLLNADLKKRGSEFFVNGDPLRFIHFSGVDGKVVDFAINTWANVPETHEIMLNLYNNYLKMLEKNDIDSASKIKWSYNFFTSGEFISSDSRIIYRNAIKDFAGKNPFYLSNKEILSYRITKSEYSNYNIFRKTMTYLKKYGILKTLKKIYYRIKHV